MTIIRQQKNNGKVKFYIMGMGVFTIFSVVVGIALYNQGVNYKHELARQKNDIREIEAKNAELKTGVFNLTSAQNMASIAAAKGLMVDKNPKFIKERQLASGR